MNLEDLIYYMDLPDTNVTIPPEINEARVHSLVMAQIKAPKQKKKHRIRPFVLALAAALALSITAGAAYYMTHVREAALMEQGPMDGGLYPSAVDEQGQQVIEEAAADYDMVQESQGATVTLDSVMGYHSADCSVAYVTVTVDVSEQEQTGLDLSQCAFAQMALQPTDPEQHLAGDAAMVAQQNEDGTISVMIAFLFRYQDVTEIPVTLTLKNFSAGEVRLSGTWDFEIESLELSDLTEVDTDAALLQSSFPVSDIQLSDFGGKITVQGYLSLLDSKFRAAVKERCGDSDLDLDTLSRDLNQITALYQSGGLTEVQYQEITQILQSGEINDVQIALVYPDGTEYSSVKVLYSLSASMLAAQHRLQAIQQGLEIEEETETAEVNPLEESYVLPFAFLSPQDISQAEYLVIEDVKIPLQTQ
jgi:hypothetical protein